MVLFIASLNTSNKNKLTRIISSFDYIYISLIDENILLFSKIECFDYSYVNPEDSQIVLNNEFIILIARHTSSTSIQTQIDL
jgi:hypothetical protein